MESLKRTISLLEKFIGDPSAGTTESQINDIRREVNIQKVQVTQIESIIEDETSFFRNRIKELEEKIKKEEQVLVDGPQASREAKKIVDDFDRSYYPKWKAYTKLANDIKNDAVGIKGLIVPNFPSLPDSRNGLTTQKLYKAANALMETRKNLIAWNDKNGKALEADFVAYLEALDTLEAGEGDRATLVLKLESLGADIPDAGSES